MDNNLNISIPRNAMPSTMEHLGAWYAGHKFAHMSYVTVNDWATDDMGAVTAATFTVYNEVSVEIGKVAYDRNADGDGWSFVNNEPCMGHVNAEPYEAEYYARGNLMYRMLRCPQPCGRPRGAKLIRKVTVDQPWYKQAAELLG